MSFCVLDASFAFPWLFEDEATAEADVMLSIIGDQGAVVPALWFTEIANGLGMAERRGIPLATGDKELRTAATSVGVVLVKAGP